MLPKIELPLYDFEVPSTGTKIQFRPFTVKEEKILLMALEGADKDEMINAVKQILRNCVVTESFDTDQMAFFDFELLMLALRSKTQGEEIKLNYVCKNSYVHEPQANGATDCGNRIDITLQVSDIKLSAPVKRENRIEFSPKVGIIFKYPSINLMNIISEEQPEFTQLLEMIASCVDYVYENDDIHYGKDFTTDEIIEFFEGLEAKQFEKIEDFFANLPRVKHELNATCSKCGFEHKITLEGLQSFFV